MVRIGLLLGGIALATQVPRQEKTPDLVVHEWGTFTSIQASDGITLDGMNHSEEALPPFVYHQSLLREARGSEERKSYYDWDGKAVAFSRSVNQRLETPVTYFYADEEMEARVRVRFSQGLFTQWYPRAKVGHPSPLEQLNGTLDWGRIRIIPTRHAQGISLPEAPKGAPWLLARKTDSAIVQAADDKGAFQHEKYLFYRGMGRFDSPITVTTQGEQPLTLTLENVGAKPLQHIFILKRGKDVSYVYRDSLNPRSKMQVTLPDEGEQSISELQKALAEKLVAQGLYEKEARAMVRTWAKSWFENEGLRVFYVLPESMTRALLPLEIDPQPREFKRVMVGRLECLTREREERAEAHVTNLVRPDPSTPRGASQAEFAKLGAFQEPVLHRIMSKTKDAAVRKKCEELLKEFYR